MKFYKSLKFCPVFNFFESNEDIRYLLVLDDYMELPEKTEEELNELRQTKEILTNEFNERSSIETDILFEKNKKLIRIQYDQRFILKCLFILSRKYAEPTINFDEIENKLIEMDYKLNYSNEHEFYKEINRLSKRAITKNNQIKRIQKEIEDIIKSSKKENKNEDYISIVLKIEMHTGIKINIYNDSMIAFIKAKNEMIKVINHKIKLNKAA